MVTCPTCHGSGKVNDSEGKGDKPGTEEGGETAGMKMIAKKRGQRK